MKILALLLFIFLPWWSYAQINEFSETSTTWQERFKPKLSVNVGVSQPFGKYTMLADRSDDRSAAGTGMYADLEFAIHPMQTSNWKTGVLIGYMYNPFQVDAAQKFFDLPILQASSWHMGYAMLGISYQSRQRLYYGLGLHVGVVAYDGGDLVIGDIDEYGTWDVYEWNYKLKADPAIKATTKIGYNISDYIGIELHCGIFYAAGFRRGEYSQSNYLMFSSQILPRTGNERSRENQNQTSVITLNIGLGFHYKFYSSTDSKQLHKFNSDNS